MQASLSDISTYCRQIMEECYAEQTDIARIAQHTIHIREARDQIAREVGLE